jgi:large subunit ribosomal protein L3
MARRYYNTSKTNNTRIRAGYPFAMLGKKVGMTQIFSESGDVIPVTVVRVGPCSVLQKKTLETDGYFAVQIGFDDKKKQRVIKPEAGHAAKAKSPVKRYVKEVRLAEKFATDYEVGMILTADLLKAGDKVEKNHVVMVFE